MAPADLAEADRICLCPVPAGELVRSDACGLEFKGVETIVHAAAPHQHSSPMMSRPATAALKDLTVKALIAATVDDDLFMFSAATSIAMPMLGCGVTQQHRSTTARAVVSGIRAFLANIPAGHVRPSTIVLFGDADEVQAFTKALRDVRSTKAAAVHFMRSQNGRQGACNSVDSPLRCGGQAGVEL